MSKQSHLAVTLDGLTLYRACRSVNAEEQAAAFYTLWDYLFPIVASMVQAQPDAHDFAEDCVQQTLIRIYERHHECHDPAAFLPWSRRVARNLTIDELRRRGRFTALPDGDQEIDTAPFSPTIVAPEKTVLATLTTEELRQLLEQSPLSERSRRVVIGRFIDDVTDETLAENESNLSNSEVLPSHVQVTRAKNLSKLRAWSKLQAFLQVGDRTI